MIMVGVKILNFHAILLLLLCSWWSGLCRAQSSPPSSCDTYGICGPYGVCSRQDSPICSCLQGFYPRNDQEWSSGNWTGGCVRRTPLDCEASSNRTSDEFLRLKKMKLAGFSDMWLGPENQCEARCLSNCSCLAYGYDFNVGCVFWRGTVMDIQKSPVNTAYDLCVRLSSSELDKKGGPKKIIIIVVVLALVVLSICTFFSWKWIAKHRVKRKTIQLGNVVASSNSVDTFIQEALGQVNLEELPFLKFEILAVATDNFSEAKKLGQGGFGPVYKGQLADGSEIAVKKLAEASRQGLQEFVNEVVLISKLQHRNLVRLLGFCVENKETMLIYEYMPNKSLDFFLFDPSKEILDWRKRFNIIVGICRGLLYLHRDSRLKIIHRDLKPSNILLDNNWNAKISDFGTARIFGTQQDHVSTARVVGTYGYLAPEYAMGGRFSEKSDVFSLGVLILEIVIGKRNTSFLDQDGSFNLLGHVRKLWIEDRVESLVDPRISGSSYRGEVMRCIHIGLLCVQEFAKDRPSVPEALSMLNSETVELPEPNQPAYVIKPIHLGSGTTSSQQSQSNVSVNDLTITVVDGR